MSETRRLINRLGTSTSTHVGVVELYNFCYRGTDDAYASPLSEEQVQAIQQHLDQCPECSQRITKLQKVPPTKERQRCT